MVYSFVIPKCVMPAFNIVSAFVTSQYLESFSRVVCFAKCRRIISSHCALKRKQRVCNSFDFCAKNDQS